MDLPKMRNELNAQRRKVSFNTYDITVDELVRRVATKKIEAVSGIFVFGDSGSESFYGNQ